jgi:hypothetical protein
MNFKVVKRTAISLALSGTFLLGSAVMVSAGNWQRVYRPDYPTDNRADNRYDRRGDESKGYRDGLDRGRDDARTRRSFNPNNSSHFRNGNNFYREGFRRGYEEGYREYSRGRRY